VGIRKAKERGVRFGRKPTTEAQIAKIQWMKRNGSSIRTICKEVKVSPKTVYAALT
jgi:DNA invertase Pin-like site-specific DNA recombinase